jgi:hypothetical protein
MLVEKADQVTDSKRPSVAWNVDLKTGVIKKQTDEETLRPSEH